MKKNFLTPAVWMIAVLFTLMFTSCELPENEYDNDFNQKEEIITINKRNYLFDGTCYEYSYKESLSKNSDKTIYTYVFLGLTSEDGEEDLSNKFLLLYFEEDERSNSSFYKHYDFVTLMPYEEALEEVDWQIYLFDYDFSKNIVPIWYENELLWKSEGEVFSLLIKNTTSTDRSDFCVSEALEKELTIVNSEVKVLNSYLTTVSYETEICHFQLRNL